MWPSWKFRLEKNNTRMRTENIDFQLSEFTIPDYTTDIPGYDIQLEIKCELCLEEGAWWMWAEELPGEGDIPEVGADIENF